MILKNYHTHTYRCHHATGEDREYVEAAIKAGIKTLGFADHTPQIFKNGYIGEFRMLPEMLNDYVESLTRLREEYRSEIEILIGLEAEYYPLLFEELLALVRSQPIDYMLLSHHCFGNEFDLRYPEGHPRAGKYMRSFNETEDEGLLRDYVNQQIDGIETGVFSYIGHPDAMNFIGDEEIYKKEMRRLCETALKYELPLEMNLLGIQRERHYPNEKFWQIAAEVGNCAIIGYDAHAPERFTDYPDSVKKAEELLRKYNIPRTEEINFPLK